MSAESAAVMPAPATSHDSEARQDPSAGRRPAQAHPSPSGLGRRPTRPSTEPCGCDSLAAFVIGGARIARQDCPHVPSLLGRPDLTREALTSALVGALPTDR